LPYAFEILGYSLCSDGRDLASKVNLSREAEENRQVGRAQGSTTDTMSLGDSFRKAQADGTLRFMDKIMQSMAGGSQMQQVDGFEPSYDLVSDLWRLLEQKMKHALSLDNLFHFRWRLCAC